MTLNELLRLKDINFLISKNQLCTYITILTFEIPQNNHWQTGDEKQIFWGRTKTSNLTQKCVVTGMEK